ncbi:MFS monosaccharide transporter [Purpureocillium lavendulum]|uniref:MFS monosaccharide transporter n=1 Tax=Purpureocillium lavendulum TaxID=1247861 RepID=A0AB34G7T3_9HYPO|nr:MFS monosaccharide transporter [Purpureocillium lavendulum]
MQSGTLIRIMSYYDNQQQWSGPGQNQNNWEHQSGTSTPVRSAGASAPQPQDEFAFSYQFDEVDRAFENLSKSGKGYGMGGRREFPKTADALAGARPQANRRGGLAHVVRAPTNQAAPPPMRVDSRASHGGGPRSHHMNAFDDARGPPGQNLHNFYATQRHQPSRGSNEAEQVMQAKRRMAAQRERELRNLHTEQQYQRTSLFIMFPVLEPFHLARPLLVRLRVAALSHNVLTDVAQHAGKHMSEEETRELIARQRSALYGEGPFAEKSGYVDENGNMRPGAPVVSGPASLRGPSPLTFDNIGRAPSGAEVPTPGSASDHAQNNPSPRPQSTTSPQTAGPTNKAFENAVGPQSRTSNSSPTGGSPPRDLAPGSKPGQTGATVAPIGTRPSGTPAVGASGKRSTTPLTSSGGWGRGNGVWGQSSGIGAQASVWG